MDRKIIVFIRATLGQERLEFFEPSQGIGRFTGFRRKRRGTAHPSTLARQQYYLYRIAMHVLTIGHMAGARLHQFCHSIPKNWSQAETLGFDRD